MTCLYICLHMKTVLLRIQSTSTGVVLCKAKNPLRDGALVYKRNKYQLEICSGSFKWNVCTYKIHTVAYHFSCQNESTFALCSLVYRHKSVCFPLLHHKEFLKILQERQGSDLSETVAFFKTLSIDYQTQGQKQ